MLFYIYDLVFNPIMHVLSERTSKITQQKCALSLSLFLTCALFYLFFEISSRTTNFQWCLWERDINSTSSCICAPRAQSTQRAWLNYITLHLHLADAFIQSDLHGIQVTVFTFYQLLLSLGIEPMILALLAPCSTIWATGAIGLSAIQAFNTECLTLYELLTYRHP